MGEIDPGDKHIILKRVIEALQRYSTEIYVVSRDEDLCDALSEIVVRCNLREKVITDHCRREP